MLEAFVEADISKAVSITGRPCGSVGLATDGRSHTGTNMLETYFLTSKMVGHLRSGPRWAIPRRLAAAPEQQGYRAETAVRYLRAAAHVGHVMAKQARA